MSSFKFIATVLKKIFAISIFVLLIKVSLFAQSVSLEPIASFGTRQGVNMSFVDFSPAVGNKLLYGYNGGLVFNYKGEKFFGIQVELNYSQKGWSEDLDTIQNSYSRQLNYIELPFLTHIYFGNRDLNYFANLGTSVAYLVSEKETAEINNELYIHKYYDKKIDNNFDFNIVGELGISYLTTIGTFQFGARYYYSLTSIFDYDSKTIDYDSKTMPYNVSRNQVINISLTYFLTSKK